MANSWNNSFVKIKCIKHLFAIFSNRYHFQAYSNIIKLTEKWFNPVPYPSLYETMLTSPFHVIICIITGEDYLNVEEHGVECIGLFVFNVTLEFFFKILEHRLDGISVGISHSTFHWSSCTVGACGHLAISQCIAVNLATLLVKYIWK